MCTFEKRKKSRRMFAIIRAVLFALYESILAIIFSLDNPILYGFITLARLFILIFVQSISYISANGSKAYIFLASFSMDQYKE